MRDRRDPTRGRVRIRFIPTPFSSNRTAGPNQRRFSLWARRPHCGYSKAGPLDSLRDVTATIRRGGNRQRLGHSNPHFESRAIMYESVVLAGLILQVLTLVTLGFFLLQLSTQQGHILLRLDSLKGKRAQPEDGMVASGPKGLAVGTAVADVELPDLTGKTRSLSEFRGRRIVVIYWSPDWRLLRHVGAGARRNAIRTRSEPHALSVGQLW